jgi:hypothetical protein
MRAGSTVMGPEHGLMDHSSTSPKRSPKRGHKCNRIMPGAGQLIRHVSEIYIAGRPLRPDQRYRPLQDPVVHHTSNGSTLARDDDIPTLMHDRMKAVGGEKRRTSHVELDSAGFATQCIRFELNSDI